MKIKIFETTTQHVVLVAPQKNPWGIFWGNPTKKSAGEPPAELGTEVASNRHFLVIR